MEPAFGWTQFSAQALQRVEDELAEASRGVRDELGFLALHQTYADRFFPGTNRERQILTDVKRKRLLYRLALGQPNQEDFVERMGDVDPRGSSKGLHLALTFFDP